MTEKLETISDLENKNRKLADEKRKVETSLEFLNTKFKVLHESVARLEDDSKLLVNLAASGRGNNDGEPPAAEPMVTDFEDEDEEASSESEVKGSSPVGGRLKLKKDMEVINLDNDQCISRGVHEKKSFSGIAVKNELPNSSSSIAVQQKPSLQMLLTQSKENILSPTVKPPLLRPPMIYCISIFLL